MSPKPYNTLDLRRLEQALQAAGLGDFQWDLVGGLRMISDRMAAITGLIPGTAKAPSVDILQRNVHPDDREAFRRQRDAGLAAGDAFDLKFRFIRPDDGRTIWLRMAGIIDRDAAGKATRVTGIVEDVSDAKAAQDRQRQLVAEVDHRVKNALATVQSLVQQTAKRTTSLPAFLEAFGGRLKAMGSANELLSAARWRGAAIDQLAAAVLGALAPGQTSWQGPDLFLTPRAANALSLALHELATNAVTHGALSTERGHVDLRWARVAAGGFELSWTESGGPTVVAPGHAGFGSTLLQQVTAREVNGRVSVDFRPSGLRVVILAGAPAMAEPPEVMPKAPRPRASAPVTAAGSDQLKGARILIVEDAVLLALELEQGLSDAGAIIVGPAYELTEAMVLVEEPLDAAVLDANLNGQSVMPVAQRLFQRGIPFVFATGYGQTGSPSGFDAPVICKPYDVTEVSVAVAGLLAQRAAATRSP